MDQQYSDEELLLLDPELKAIFDKRGPPRLPLPTKDNMHMIRKGFAGAMSRFNNSALVKEAIGNSTLGQDWTETDHSVEVRDGRTIKVRVYKPLTGKGKPAPVLVFMHSGGWCMGGLDTEEFLCRLLCLRFNFLVANVDFGLYPDVDWKVPQDDCYDACKWVAANAASIGGDLDAGFLLAGHSGGATWASLVGHHWRDDPSLPPITGYWFLCPIFNNEFVHDDGEQRPKYDYATQYKSWWQNKDAPLMNDDMRKSIAALVEFDYSATTLTPLGFADHQGLAPTYVAVCGMDPWRDGGILYAQELSDSGIATKVHMYPGLPHCYWNTFPQINASKTWVRQSLDGMKWVLDNQKAAKDRPKL